ncbi:MAG: glycerate kinase [Blautia sp.]|jgi:glycerate kinase
MKVVIAIDSLKGSLSSVEAGNIIKDTILETGPADVKVYPLADGGEGTVEALVMGMHGEKVEITVKGPLGTPVQATYGMIPEKKMAIMEMAQAAGITLVPDAQRNPMETTTYGVGEMILDAVKRGCRDFIIGIGGSATNDGGIGMMEALGAVFYDREKGLIGPYGKDMLKAAFVDLTFVEPKLKECRFRIACDVNNPLCGPNGCSAVFGPQKGATPAMVQEMDWGLQRFSEVLYHATGKYTADIPGTGAAGGLGFAFLTFLNGKLEPGVDMILDAISLEDDLKDADFAITGEGKLDFQTAMGKAPIGVAKMAKKYGIKVLAFSGGATEDAVECNKSGIDAYFPILQLPVTVEEAMEPETAKENLRLTVLQVFRLIRSMENK